MLTMMTRFAPIHTVAALALVAMLALAGWVRAEESDPPQRLDSLLEALADETAEGPRRIERQVLELWSQSGSDSMDFLLMRGRRAIEAEDYDKAIEHLSSLIELEPEFAEAWNARATAHYQQDDYWSAVGDLQRALELEPRHFAALSGLAIMLERVGADAAALAAYRAALEINPHMEGPKAAVTRLAPKVDGREI